MSRTKEACGCKHDGAKWLELCPAHATEISQVHETWREDYYRTARPDPERTRKDGSDLL